MAEHTSERLAVALEAAGYLDLAMRARCHEFHDFLTPHAMPQHVLVNALRQRGRRAQPVRARDEADTDGGQP